MATQNNTVELLPQDEVGIKEENKPMKYEVENIKALSQDLCERLECGDVVIKKTGKQKHAYKVSYKGEGVGEGMCLTYADASCVETVSYDFTAEGWAYNSTDVTPLVEE